jgi:hypothetical protein
MSTFQDCLEATEFMSKIQTMLQDPRLKDWIRETDDNFGTDLYIEFVEAKQAYQQFLDKMFLLG